MGHNLRRKFLLLEIVQGKEERSKGGRRSRRRFVLLIDVKEGKNYQQMEKMGLSRMEDSC